MKLNEISCAFVFLLGLLQPYNTVSAANSSKCVWDQYYDFNVDNCAPCSEICDHKALTRTEQQCDTQCADYLKAKPPSNNQDEALDLNSNTDTSHSSSSSSSWFPGILASAGIGVGAVAFIAVGFVVYRYKHPAGTGSSRVNRNRRQQGNDVRKDDTRICIPLAPPVQVSSEDVATDYTISAKRSEAVADPLAPALGMAECDPAAPSSAAHIHVNQQQFC